MTEAVVVYSVEICHGTSYWQLDEPAHSLSIKALISGERTTPLRISPKPEAGLQPTFSTIEGLDGALAIRMDELRTPGIGYVAHYHTDVFELVGEVEGSLLVIPPIATVFSEAQVGAIDRSDIGTWPFRHDGIDSGLFRVGPFAEQLLCGERVMEPEERVTDLEHYVHMEFPDWLRLSQATGLTLREEWRYSYLDDEA